MKTSIKKTTTRKVTLLFAILFSLIAVSSNSFAAGTQYPVQSNYSVKYVGTSDNGIVFHIKYENPDAARFDVILKNQDGVILFQKTFSDKELNKDIVLTKDMDLNKVSFIVKSAKGYVNQDFTIQTKTVEIVDVQASN